jgi:hypothetical protein
MRIGLFALCSRPLLPESRSSRLDFAEQEPGNASGRSFTGERVAHLSFFQSFWFSHISFPVKGSTSSEKWSGSDSMLNCKEPYNESKLTGLAMSEDVWELEPGLETRAWKKFREHSRIVNETTID